MINYKGIGGGAIMIDGENVKLKFCFLKEECHFADITLVNFNEPELLKNGSVDIFTNKSGQTPYSLVFKKSKRDEFYKLYEYLEENTSSAERKAIDAATVSRLADQLIEKSNNMYTPKCPKCGSTSISADKKGFGVGKAVVGAAVAGPIGLVAGNMGAKKVRITCLNCGHQWMAGKG